MYLGDKAGPPTRKPRPRGDLKSVPRQWRGGGPFISKWLVSFKMDAFLITTVTQACYEIENDNQAGGNIQRWR